MSERKDMGGWHQYNAALDAYEKLRDDVLEDAREAGLSKKHLNKLELGIEEIAVNIISYAYEDSGFVWVRTFLEGGFFKLEFVDHGNPFNPLSEDRRPTDGIPTVGQAEGGYGIFLVKRIFASVTYRYEQMFGKMANHLTMELLV